MTKAVNKVTEAESTHRATGLEKAALRHFRLARALAPAISRS